MPHNYETDGYPGFDGNNMPVTPEELSDHFAGLPPVEVALPPAEIADAPHLTPAQGGSQ